MTRALVLAALLVISGGCASNPDDTTGPVSSPTSEAPASTTTAATTETAEQTVQSESLPADRCLSVAATTGESGRQSTVTIELEAAGSVYPIRVYVPDADATGATATEDGRLPVVLNWHGLGSDGFQQALLTNYEAVAEAEGFMVVHPTGAVADSDTSVGVQAGWELAQFDVPGRDDLMMVDALIDRLVADYCADPARVYSTGLSNGGFFTSRLVCERSDRIAAAVVVAGVTHPDDCNPTRAVPFMAFHGTADRIVPFDGGPSQLENESAPPELVEFFDQVMPDELAEFAVDFGCDIAPIAEEFSDEVTVYSYEGCANDVPLRFVEINGGGHTWPGAFLGVFMTDALGPTTTDIDATAEGWRFMSRFSLAAS